MKILCTHPGRYGDCLWALPTVRAIAESYQTPVDLLVSPAYSAVSFCHLLGQQVYIDRVFTLEGWSIRETAPISPREPPVIPEGYDTVVHLGYVSWPEKDAAREAFRLAAEQITIAEPIDLGRPWITTAMSLPSYQVAVGFTDEYFELKYGLYWLLRKHFDGDGMIVNICTSPRWQSEAGMPGFDWESAASWIKSAKVFVGCCSAMHVLAVALGTPVVLCEPQTARHHDVFYPTGTMGPYVWLVKGGDGLPTFDARHLMDAVTTVLQLQGASV